MREKKMIAADVKYLFQRTQLHKDSHFATPEHSYRLLLTLNVNIICNDLYYHV